MPRRDFSVALSSTGLLPSTAKWRPSAAPAVVGCGGIAACGEGTPHAGWPWNVGHCKCTKVLECLRLAPGAAPIAANHGRWQIPPPAVFLRALIASLAAAALAATHVSVATAAEKPTRADYENCQAVDEQGFRKAIEAIALNALQAGLAAVDFKAVVSAEWRRGGLDGIIDKRVDAAIAEVRDETSWSELLQSLAYQEKAKELATTVAERVYRSDEIKAAIEQLAGGVGRSVGRNIELAAVDATGPALQCLQAFLGPRFGTMVARVVAGDAGKEFTIDPAKAGARVSATSVLAEGGEGLAGAVILMVRRQLSGMASRIGHRLVGAVLGRLVSIVAGGVGVVLIAKDIWELRSGVLPIIADEMKSKATKDRVQDELARSIAEQLGEQIRDLATKTADRVAEVWREFRRAHAKSLDLTERHDAFRAFLDTARAADLPRIDELVGIIAAGEGDEAVLNRLRNGTLGAAVLLPEPAMEIAREARSVDAALRWTALAGDRLGAVTDYGIHQRARPEELTSASLARILGLNDRLAAVRLAAIGRQERDVLLELDDGDLRALARGLTEADLGALSGYLAGLRKDAGQRVLRAVAQNPARMQDLAPLRVRSAVLASRDQDAAVAMMLRTESLPDPVAIGSDFGLVLDGRVSPILLWEKHPVVLSLMALLALAALLLLMRLVGGRRRGVAA